MRELEAAGRTPTAEERRTLNRYTGWGGLPGAFNEEQSDPAWAARSQELRELLGNEEYVSAKDSTPNAHYTSLEVIEAMWSMVQRLGFRGGRILEPAAGVGYFLGGMPAEIVQRSQITAVELDQLSARMLKALYGAHGVRITQGAFEGVRLPEGFFDLAIGNVPFGNYKVAEMRNVAYQDFLIHDYFFAKALELVRPGGLVVFITSSGTLDKAPLINNSTILEINVLCSPSVSTLAELTRKLRSIWPHLDERTRRITAANEAMSLGFGGVSLVHRASGLSRQAITRGIRELETGKVLPPGRVRRAGAGRKAITTTDPELLEALDGMIEGGTRGDPESPLRWICKSTRAIAKTLDRQSHPISHVKVAQILHDQNYSLQSNRKTEEGADHPDRDAQFRHISAQVKKCLEQGIPVISVDTKKKELVGNYENKGQQWLRAKHPRPVEGHDFPGPDVPRAYPYGIYDIGRNVGYVNVGTDHDTGAFAVASIRGWWRAEGGRIYAKTKAMLITADGGGSNGSRLRLWKLELQKFADETGLQISVCHFPPGTSKWNKIEHRLFSFISSNWRGEPLRDYETIVNLIARTTTAKGLKVICRLDRRKYPTGRRVSNDEMKRLNLKRNKFHGEWNYVISPRAT